MRIATRRDWCWLCVVEVAEIPIGISGLRTSSPFAQLLMLLKLLLLLKLLKLLLLVLLLLRTGLRELRMRNFSRKYIAIAAFGSENVVKLPLLQFVVGGCGVEMRKPPLPV